MGAELQPSASTPLSVRLALNYCCFKCCTASARTDCSAWVTNNTPIVAKGSRWVFVLGKNSHTDTQGDVPESRVGTIDLP